ncbi:MAG: GIY-YIG nuclease family protein [Planctomycetota bacterium]
MLFSWRGTCGAKVVEAILYLYIETVEKPFNGVILSEAKNLTKHSFETLHFVQGEIVDFVNNLILHSDSLNKYYVGSTQNLVNRLREHNSGEDKFTKAGVPWELVKSFEFNSRTESVRIEYKIKKRGIERFLKSI